MEHKEYVITFDPEKCSQCHGCETACKSWRQLDHGIRFRRVLTLWQGEYPNTRNSSLSLACLHCFEPSCIDACPVEAIAKQADGLVLVDGNLCIGCGTCKDACEYDVPQIHEGEIMQKCDLCQQLHPPLPRPPCVDTCPGEALQLVKIEINAKQEQELITRKRYAPH